MKEPHTSRTAGESSPRAGELRIHCAGFGAELTPQLGRCLAGAAAAVGSLQRLGPDARWAKESIELCRRRDALGVAVAGPLIGNAELVRLAHALGGRRGLAPIVALRGAGEADEAALLLAHGCCDVLEARSASARELLGALRLAFEVARRQRAESPWLEDEETTAAWPPPALVETRRLAALGRGFAALTHDLKNLLQPLLIQADLVAAAGEARSAADEARRLGELVREAERLLRRSLARALAGPGAPAPEREGDELLRECEPLLELAAGPAVRLGLVPGAPGVRIAVADGALDQLLLNLAANARDAMPAGGVLEVRSREEAGAWLVEVEDSGTGLATPRLERIFEPGPLGAGPAAGLGLWIVHGLVGELGGTLAAASRVGRGTRVTVRLPAAGGGYQPSR
jgi:signal transduction histidine kinase